MRSATRRLAFCLVLASSFAGCGPPPAGRVALRVVDAETREPLPARVEWLGPDGVEIVPDLADGTVGLTFECVSAPPEGGLPPTPAIDNPHTGTTQFYTPGTLELFVPAGQHRVRAFRGIEYRVAEQEFDVTPGTPVIVEVPLERWADEPARGWYAADDHLHITRRTPEEEERIATWMQAEDLNVANLLQMGTAAQFSVTPQYAFGEAGVARSGEYLLVPGQEHPRTHFFGHTITLGASEPVDLREEYALYDRFFRRGQELGGATGFAHWGEGVARRGVALTAPHGLVDFVEVLQFQHANYDVWYEMLDLGLRVAPSAGTDFPCGPWSMPGRERVYFSPPDGVLDPAGFVAAMKAGRTFVTNGPLIEFAIDETEIGGEVVLGAARDVRVHGRVRFDPSRDDVTGVELVTNGALTIPLVTHPAGPGELRFDQPVLIDRTRWLALRVSGRKVGEQPVPPIGLPDWVLAIVEKVASGAQGFEERDRLIAADPTAPSAAHTGAIWVTVEGTAPLREQEHAHAVLRRWAETLDDVSERLRDENLGDQGIWDWVPYSDGLPEDQLREHRPFLLGGVEAARAQLGLESNPPADNAAGEDGS